MTATNTKHRSTSLYLLLNKYGVKSARRLRKLADGDSEATASECMAHEAILRLLLPYDPALAVEMD